LANDPIDLKESKGLTDLTHYHKSAYNTEIVGNFVGRMINYLINYGGSSKDDFHLIGFSLGAHVVGQAGRASNKLFNPNKLPRITG